MTVYLQTENETDSLAQLVEHIPFKDGVLGSNPRRITKAFQRRLFFYFSFILLYESHVYPSAGIGRQATLRS